MTTHKLVPLKISVDRALLQSLVDVSNNMKETDTWVRFHEIDEIEQLLSAAPPQEALAAPESLEELLEKVPEFHCVNIWREEHKSFESNYGWICGLEDTRNAEARTFASTGRGKTPAEAIRNALEGK